MITIVLPTYNRSGLLIRALRFYNTVKFKGSILIGDSSTGIHLNRVRDAVAVFSNTIDIKYCYFPAATETPSPWKVKGGNVLRLLGEMVQTPYVTYAGDDDFALPSGVDRCVNFLDHNHDYAAAHGIRVALCVKKHGAIAWATFSCEHNLESASARDRWIGFINNPISTQFHVIRTDVWREMHRYTDTSLISNFADELLPCSLSVAAGKIKFLDYLSTIMQVKENRSLTAINTFEIIHQPDFPETYRVMKKAVTEKLAAQDCVNVSEVEKLFEKKMWEYLLAQLPWQFAIRYDPHFVEKRTNSLHLLLDPASVYYNDFKEVYTAITNDLESNNESWHNSIANTSSTDIIFPVDVDYKDSVNPPTIFAIETTLACDLKCPECAIGAGMVKRSRGLMTFDQYKVIADKIRPYAQYVYLHIWGEPMLNPDIFEMIEYTATFAKSNISTNGQSMTPVMAERLINSGVTDIIVSLDGVTQEIYEQYRVGGSLKKALETLAILQHFNAIHGGHVNITPQFIVFKHNQHQIEDFRKISGSLGLTPYFKPPYIRIKNSCFQYSELSEYFRPHFPDFTSLKSAMSNCSSPKQVFNVLVDGTVVACCHDYGGFTNFGNIFIQDVMEIWNGQKMNAFRTALASGNTSAFCLNKCMSYFLDETEDGHKVISKQDLNIEETGKINPDEAIKINLCCGSVKVDGYVGIDIFPEADITLDLEKNLLPFPDNSADVIACISAINYFSPDRAQEIAKDVFRVLKPGGTARFASQDLRVLAAKYLNNDQSFFFEKLADGRDRFPGRTIADKFNGFFYGFYSGDKHCKYVYDFDSLKALFIEAGFSNIVEKKYQESCIPAVDKLDNRPEQMFFLEAVKNNQNIENDSETKIGTLLRKIRGSVQEKKKPIICEGSEYNQAVQLWNSGLHEQAWQYLLKALDDAPGNRMAVVMCSGILKKSNRLADLLSLYEKYLSHGTGDSEIQRELDNTRKEKLTAEIPAVLINQRRVLLNKQFAPRNSIQDDKIHLAGCIKWLSVAHDVNKRGGVAAFYYLDSERWEVDYPETTGYIIPVFLCYYRLTGDEEYLKRAIAMGDWEISIQYPGGGVGEPVGVYGLKPRVFNTSQVILGWLALYRETGKDKYLEAAKISGDWIVTNQDPDGNWSKNTYQGPRAYKSRVAWALLELFALTGIKKYQEAAEHCIAWVMDKSLPNGWFSNNSLSDPEKPWTHLIGYVLTGLLEIYRLDNSSFDRSNMMNVLQNAAKTISDFYLKQKKNTGANFVTLVGTFDSAWQSKDNWSCITGTAQLEFFLRRMQRYVNDPQFLKAADMLIEDLKKLQMLDGFDNPNIFGGMPGSYPIGVGYCAYSIPNWGVKFFADSLLQRLLSEENQKFLG